MGHLMYLSPEPWTAGTTKQFLVVDAGRHGGGMRGRLPAKKLAVSERIALGMPVVPEECAISTGSVVAVHVRVADGQRADGGPPSPTILLRRRGSPTLGLSVAAGRVSMPVGVGERRHARLSSRYQVRAAVWGAMFGFHRAGMSPLLFGPK
ncbi:hypothetical protein [Streptomyces scabiei]|uniref:hypothetical protein n=1 Tax=Streptomyces scabiei TaxID=1930 RepID=UPI002FEF823C